jgi:DNA-3-methyladenine glycosylase
LKLHRPFYQQATIEVARQWLGKGLVGRHRDGTTIGRIVESEAYIGPHDKACHAARGRTARTEVMFGPPGHAYVYFVYGFHHMLNIVTEQENFPAAVLIRAVEPVGGIALMKRRRGDGDLENLASGPGKLCQAFAIDRTLNGSDVCGDVLFVRDPGEPVPEVVATPRIGVDYAGHWKYEPLRFLISGSRFVSKR